jgi:uncharacterized protein
MKKMLKYQHKGTLLRGSVHIPEGTGSFPAVLMLHGFGSNRMGSQDSFVNMGNRLEAGGFAVFRFDFSGNGESEGDFFDMTVTKQIEEANALIHFCCGQSYVDHKQFHLLGMSLGSVVASMAAGTHPELIKSICLWSPAAVIVDEITQQRTIQGQSIDVFATQGYMDIRGRKLGPALLDDVKVLDIYGMAAHYRGLVKIIHGDADKIAPIRYAEKYMEVYPESAELVTVTGANHGWATVADRAILFDETERFYLQQVGGDSSGNQTNEQ